MEEIVNQLITLVGQCQQEIEGLKEENRQQELKFRAMQDSFHVISDSIGEIVNNSEPIAEKLDGHENLFVNTDVMIQRIMQIIENIKYEVLDPNRDRSYYYYPNIVEASIAIDKIVQERKSLARFGDGEFSIMMKVERQKFQHMDDKLAERLYETLHSQNPDLLVAIAANYGSLDKYNANGALGIRLYMT